MPIPFRDAEDIQALGTAAYLHIEPIGPDANEWAGALLCLNGRGEPLEFVYNRLTLLSDTLWRPSDRAEAALRRLSVTLFDAVRLSPLLLLCPASITPPRLFGPEQQFNVAIPVGRVALATEAPPYSPAERREVVKTADREGEVREVSIYWTPGPPTDACAALFARLRERGLLLEPFDRIRRGLNEVYREVFRDASRSEFSVGPSNAHPAGDVDPVANVRFTRDAE